MDGPLVFSVNGLGRGRWGRVRPEIRKLSWGYFHCPHHSSDPGWVHWGPLAFLLLLTPLLPQCSQGKRPQAHLPPPRGAGSSAPGPRSLRRGRPALPHKPLQRCKGRCSCLSPSSFVSVWCECPPLLGGWEGMLWPLPRGAAGEDCVCPSSCAAVVTDLSVGLARSPGLLVRA